MYKFIRQFSADVEDPSVNNAGPDAIKRDFDELGKMFDPSSFHDDGTPGGIFVGNLSGDIVDPQEGDVTLPEITASRPIDGLLDESGNAPVHIWTQIKSVFWNLLKHESESAAMNHPHGLRIFRDASLGGVIQYKNEAGAWESAVSRVPGFVQSLADNLNVTTPGVLSLDARQGNVLKGNDDGLNARISALEEQVAMQINDLQALETDSAAQIVDLKMQAIVLSEQITDLKSQSPLPMQITLFSFGWADGLYVIKNPIFIANSNLMSIWPEEDFNFKTDITHDAWTAANIFTYSQANGSVTLKAWDGAPTIDLPIVVNIFKRIA